MALFPSKHPPSARLTRLVLLTLLLAGPRAAQAGDPKADSARYFGLGNAAFDAGQHEEAVRMFRVSIALTPDLAGPHRRIGQALKRLDRCDEALDHFLAYLRLKPVGTYSDEIRQEMAECAEESESARSAPGERVASSVLRLSIGVDDAVVKVDGLEMGTSPLPPLTLKAGIHRIEVSHPGFHEATRTVDLGGGEELELAIHLQQKEEAPPVKARARPAKLGLTIIPNGVRVAVDGKLVGLSPVGVIPLEPGSHKLQLSKPGFLPEEHLVDAEDGQPIELELKLMRLEGSQALAGLLEEEPLSGRPPSGLAQGPAAPGPGEVAGGGGPPAWLAWTVLGGGAACLGGGVVLGALALSAATAYEDGGAASDRRALRDSGQQLALAADLVGGIGLALALGGVTLHLLRASEPAAPAPAALTPSALRPAAGSSPTFELLVGPGLWGVAGRFR
ncbi:MAG: PEGA domain-containing protein [Deltaproteobacteria bacterium]|nr:PEGA domain-containing protein [Deltaproteobacteria bacterium]